MAKLPSSSGRPQARRLYDVSARRVHYRRTLIRVRRPKTRHEWPLPSGASLTLYSSPRSLPSDRGVREVGDAIITVGDVAAVVQVKARTAPSADTRRERSWLQSRIRKATRQAIGTMRRFNAAAGVPTVNLRGREITIEGRSKAWVPVVVLDHPGGRLRADQSCGCRAPARLGVSLPATQVDRCCRPLSPPCQGHESCRVGR